MDSGRLTVDGQEVALSESDSPILLHTLRDHGFTAPKLSCGRGECGACTVLVGEHAVMACTTLTALVDAPVTTAAGLGPGSDDLRGAFADHAAFQCGFCTPGQLVRAEALLRENPDRSREEFTRELVGNVCRCTGYVQIVDAVCAAAAGRAGGPNSGGGS